MKGLRAFFPCGGALDVVGGLVRQKNIGLQRSFSPRGALTKEKSAFSVSFPEEPLALPAAQQAIVHSRATAVVSKGDFRHSACET